MSKRGHPAIRKGHASKSSRAPWPTIPAGVIPVGALGAADLHDEDGFNLHSWRQEFDAEMKRTAPSLAAQAGALQPSASTASFTTLRSATSKAPSLPPLHMSELQDGLAHDEKVNISQAVFTPHDPLLYNVCRGNMNAVLALREGCAVQSARDRLRHIDEVGLEQRRKATEWREREQSRRGLLSARSTTGEKIRRQAPISRLVQLYTRGELALQEQPEPEMQRTPVRRALTGKLAAPSPHESKPQLRHSGSVDESILTARSSVQSEDFDLKESNDAIAEPTSSFRAALRERLKEREQEHRRKVRQAKQAVKERQKTVTMADKERELEQHAFRLYADNSMGAMAVENLLRFLLELGLAGSTYHERLAVEKLLKQVYLTLLRVQGSLDGKALSALQVTNGEIQWLQVLNSQTRQGQLRSTGLPGDQNLSHLFRSTLSAEVDADEEDDKLQPFPSVALAMKAVSELLSGKAGGATEADEEGKAQVRFARTRKQDHPEEALIKIARRIPVCFDDLSAEIIPMVRSQLQDMRGDRHLEAFQNELEKIPSMEELISSSQLARIALGFGLDTEVTFRVLQDVGAALKEQGVETSAQWLDSDGARDLLVFIEERSERKKHAEEHLIREATELTLAEFWKFRGELVKVRSLMQVMASRDGKMDRTGVNQLLKQLGLQPYHVKQRNLVEECLEQISNGEQMRYGFKDILRLVQHIREGQKADRQDKLWRFFKLHVKTGHNSFPMDQVDNILFDPVIGLNLRINTIDEAEAVKRVIDEMDTASPGDLSFSELEDMCQRTFEIMHGTRARDAFKRATAEGVSLDTFAEFQQLFDRYDVDCSGTLEIEEIREALYEKAGRPLTAPEIEQIYSEKSLSMDVPLGLWDFLRLMDASIILSRPFALCELTTARLRECLSFFAVPLDQIGKLSLNELADKVAECLGISSTANLKELEPPITSTEALIRFARVRGREFREKLEAEKAKHRSPG